MREDRKKLLEEYQGDKPRHLVHPWIDYDRYRYSDKIITTLKEREVDFSTLIVMDYGSGVGDYGFEFGRNGSEVIFFDNETYINFLQFRLEKDETKFKAHLVELLEVDKLVGLPFPDLIIFGEVLEHLDDPLFVLKDFVEKGAKYIFTSSYPFRNDDPNDDYWNHPGHVHNTSHFQPACRKLLFDNYERIQYNGEASLWVRKD